MLRKVLHSMLIVIRDTVLHDQVRLLNSLVEVN